ANNLEYGRTLLAGMIPPGGFMVICNGTAGTCTAGAVPPGVLVLNFTPAQDNIQNGAPDAIGLFDLSNNTAIDVISYEGSITAGGVPNVGTSNFVEGTPTTASEVNTAPNLSLQRLPNGSDTDDANTDWTGTNPPTIGAPN